MDEGTKLHLKEWLIAQIESGRYEGLCWEDEDKTMFRIPWKHAAKKDYKQTEDAALFKAWAVYKGKYKEGRDKADPTMWKTRLRCALNKSTDFQEVPERSQLDISEPYKVYRIQNHNFQVSQAVIPVIEHQVIRKVKQFPRSPSCPGKQVLCQKEVFQTKREEKPPADLMMEHMYCGLSGTKKPKEALAPLAFPTPPLKISDFRMQVVLLYQGKTVLNATTRSTDGCFILQGRVPLGNESIYGPCAAQQLSFPSPSSVSLPACMADAMNRLLCHLERGVLLWMASDGVFIKRFCQGRVYWSGPMAQHNDRPNKLEREKTFKLLDIPIFLHGLQSYLQGKGPPPPYKIELCFGEEYPDPGVPKNKKLIMAQVVPLFAVELLERFNLGETEEKHPCILKTEEEKMEEP
ncbi:interferon regulatory factor 10 [Oryzias melastigma]|uniref:Interferon regulatory factor 10 n=1 Tax=Oryzias melastigma TaxID=30732 RepID=A0A3B3BMC3_ORYME|nr:interferon regulatory factor 10 [Oryzias melastigma]